jgi:gliding motility associated protien GldN
MRIILIAASFIFYFFGSVSVSFSQENLNEGFNDLSVRPIHASDIMFKKRVWRRMNLKEKQNASFFSNGRELTKMILDAAKKGIITPYESDTLGTPMSMDKLLENLTDPFLAEEDEEKGAGEEGEDGGGDDDWGGGGDDWGGGGDDWGSEDEGDAEVAEEGLAAEEEVASTGPSEDEFYLPNQLFVVELQEDAIFDKERSRMYYDILTVKIVIDGTLRPDGVDFDLAVFSYKELSEKLFKDNPEAIWYNPENSAAHLNLQSAFDLRLFASRIVKVGNAEDEHIADIFGGGDPKNVLYGSEWWEMKLMQYEHELWSY